jgi:TonB family protein
MRSSLWAPLLCLAMLSVAPAFAQTPSPGDVRPARVAPLYPVTRCPDVRQTDLDDAAGAVVLVYVGTTGVPSKASLKTSSGSAALDNAALSCVQKLRFLPAMRLGDATAVASWQEIALKAYAPPQRPAAPAAGVAASAPAAAAAPVAAAAGRASGEPHTDVRVCVDDSGKLTQDPQVTHPSGDAALDTATLSIAKAGSGYYRPAGCLQLSIRADRK